MKILLKLKNAKPMVIDGEDLSYNHGYVFEGSVKQVINFNLDAFEYIIWDQDKVKEYLTDTTDKEGFVLKGSDIMPGTRTAWTCTRCRRDEFILKGGLYECPACGYSPNNTDIKP